MIRRSPTRLEFKLEDLQEYDYVHKMDRKRSILATAGTEEGRKLLRQERIGYMNPPAVMVAQSRTHARRNADAVASASAGSHAASTAVAAPVPTPTPSTTAISSNGGAPPAATSGPAAVAAATTASSSIPSQITSTGASTVVEPMVTSAGTGLLGSNHPILVDVEPEGDDSSNMSIDTEDESQDQEPLFL